MSDVIDAARARALVLVPAAIVVVVLEEDDAIPGHPELRDTEGPAVVSRQKQHLVLADGRQFVPPRPLEVGLEHVELVHSSRKELALQGPSAVHPPAHHEQGATRFHQV